MKQEILEATKTLQDSIKRYYAVPEQADFSWLYEEIGELAEGMLNKDTGNQMEELPQGVIWILSYANARGFEMADLLKNVEFSPKGKQVKRPLPLKEPAVRFIPTDLFSFEAKPVQKLQELVAEEYGVLDEKDGMLNYVWALGYASKGLRKGKVDIEKEHLAKAFLCSVMQANALGLDLSKCVEQAVLKYLCDYGNTYHGKEYARRVQPKGVATTAPARAEQVKG